MENVEKTNVKQKKDTEIIFCGLHLISKKTIYGYYTKEYGEEFIHYQDNDFDSMSGPGMVKCPIEPNSMRQYTGYKAITGDRIYE